MDFFRVVCLIIALLLLGDGLKWILCPERNWRFYLWGQVKNPDELEPAEGIPRGYRVFGIFEIFFSVVLIVIVLLWESIRNSLP